MPVKIPFMEYLIFATFLNQPLFGLKNCLHVKFQYNYNATVNVILNDINSNIQYEIKFLHNTFLIFIFN